MKSFIKKLINNKVLQTNIQSVSIHNDNEIRFSFHSSASLPFFKRFLVIRDRETGRKLEKVIRNNTVKITFSDLFDMCMNGKYDLHVKTYFLNSKFSKRLSYKKGIELIDYKDDSNKIKFKLLKTVKNNLSFTAQKLFFAIETNEIKAMGRNIYLSGTLEQLNHKTPHSCAILLIRRDNKKSYSFNCNLVDVGNKTFKYNSILFMDKFRKDLVINSRWDGFIQIKDVHDQIIQSEIINLDGYRDFSKEEDRYLLNIEENQGTENVLAIYATMGIQSFAMWYTDKEQFNRTYNIAKGKTVYNQTCEQEDIDPKMIFFESFFGKNYSGNPKYIYEEMLSDNRYKDFTFVWSYSGEHPEVIPGNAIIVNRESTEYYRYLAKAKYWVSNIVFPVHRKREGNVYIQTWHGTPLKKLGWDIEIEGPETLARENFYIESRNWDYLISANSYSSKIFRRAFKFEKEMLEVGYPANDIFYKPNLTERVTNIKTKLGIPLNKKVILYAPTWRDDEMVGSWNHSFQLKFDLDDYYKALNDDYVLLLRMHHLISDSLQIDEKYSSFVYDLSKYDDIQELYLISDIAITDYSSVFFDYANSKRPILFFAYDFDKYRDNIRGFYLDMKTDLPGPILQTSEELLHAILHIDSITEQYKEKYEEFYNTYCSLEDGHAAKRVLERVIEE